MILHLPITVMRRESAGADRQHPKTPALAFLSHTDTDLDGLTVLVLDDQEDARELVKRVLEDCGATVVTADSAAAALRLIEATLPDVLVSDIGLPDTDGYEFIRLVRALAPERGGRIPAIALTAFARAEDRIRALRAGFAVHVSKPVDPSELVATVASVAGRVDGQSK